MKVKILIGLGILTIICFGFGITYSIFTSNTNLEANQSIAKFIFNAEKMDVIQLPLVDLNPGDNKEYLFKVTNNSSGVSSGVSIDYKLVIETFRMIPLDIKLYKINGKNEDLKIDCSNNIVQRNEENQVICNGDIQTMSHSANVEDNYKLKISFPSEYSGVEYSNLVDYINIKVNSWQK